ncbi:MAG: hypothetical protein K8R59_13765 [Thermoanaerobaculales bacterium]|nr:hypothetical protein [Thermoanaerobaculales bacterium]
MRRFVVVLCAVVALGLAVNAIADGYVVFLKGGERIRCKEPLSIDGKLAILTLVTGQVTSYPLDQIDLVETERYNKLGLGDAYVIEELEQGRKRKPTPTPRQSLGNYATLSGDATPSDLGVNVEPSPTPTPGIKLQGYGYREQRVDMAFTEILDKKNLYLYRTSAGTRPEYFFVQAVTDTQREVFHALKTVAEAFTLIAKLHPDLAPVAVELRMIETSGRTAGTFRFSQEDADRLTSNKISPEKFYVENVIF